MATNSLNSTDDLATIFNDCLERLAAGQSLDDCLAIYPRYAAQLRALLETRAAVRRARATSQEVAAAQERIRFRLQGYTRRATPTFDLRRVSGIAVLLLALLLAGFGVQRAITYLNQPTATSTMTLSATLTPTLTMTVSATSTTTSTVTPSMTTSATLTPSFTPIATSTPADLVPPTVTRPTPVPTRRPTQPSNPPPTGGAGGPPPTDDHGGRGSDGGGGPGPGGGSQGGGSGSGRGGGDD